MSYFHQVAAATSTRVWVNNPSLADARAAIADGAVACTTNPTYAAKELEAEPKVAARILDEAIGRSSDDEAAAALAQDALCSRLMELFRGMHEADPERSGFVSVQGSPLLEEDADAIVASALRSAALGKNCIAKIPVTAAGLVAIRAVASEGVPIIATEVMSASQALAAFAAWEEGVRPLRKAPPLFITHITGVLEERLSALAAASACGISAAEIRAASLAAARRQYELLRSRGFRGRMLGGGARSVEHFTGMVGLDMDVTINWRGTADALLEADPPIAPRSPVGEGTIEKARALLPEFDAAWREDGLEPDEFAGFGAVVLFRGRFMEGWRRLLAAVGERRAGAYTEGGILR
jgi:transaldolase